MTRTAAAEGLEEIAPLVEPQTIAVARIDLDALDFEPSLAAITGSPGFSSDTAALLREAAAQSARLRHELRESGTERIWATLNLSDLTRGPAILIPAEEPGLGARLQARKTQLWGVSLGALQIHEVGGIVVIGPPATVERLAARPAASRPELAETLGRVADFPIALAVAPTEEMQRVMREMLPDVPPDWGGASGRTLADAFAQLAVGINLSPPAHAVVRIESASEAAAEAVLPMIRTAAERSGLPVSAEGIRRNGSAIIYRMDDAAVRAAVQALTSPLGRAIVELRRQRSARNLKQIGVAMHNYYGMHKHFPPTGKASDGAAEGLSWRVHLLPFVEESALYEQFHLDEPWDSPHNRPLVERIPDVYRSPLAPGVPAGKTTYQLPRMEGSLYGTADDDELPQFRDVTDGISNTALVFESNPASAVVWTRPDDLQIDPENPGEKLRVEGRDFVPMLHGDGAVSFLPPDLDPETLRALITSAGGERASVTGGNRR